MKRRIFLCITVAIILCCNWAYAAGTENAKDYLKEVFLVISFFVAPLLFLSFGLASPLNLVSDKTSYLGRKYAFAIFLISLLLYSYKAFNNIFFAWLAVFVFFLYLLPLVKKKFWKNFKKPSSEDVWVCRSCGIENNNVYKECWKCGVKREN